MPARVAGFGVQRSVVTVGWRVVILVGWREMLVLVRSGPVLMLRVMVVRVLMHVHRRSHGG